MRGVTLESWGVQPVVREVADPVRTPGTAVVRMLAAGLNPVDLAIAAGRFYGATPEPPFVMGAEAVGAVVHSDRFPAGTRVWCLTTVGAFAEEFICPDTALVPVPDDLSDVDAAAIGIAGLAGWMSTLDRGGVVAGQTVLVLGASGVAGQVAVQAARRAGAERIVAVARTKEGVERALALGAHWFVAFEDRPDVAQDLRDACAPGAHVVIDMLWGSSVPAVLGAMRQRACLVQVGSAAGATATITGGALRGGRIDIRGFSVFSEHPDDLARSYQSLAAAYAAGEVALRIETLPLSEAPIAWARQANGTAGRKLVLVP